MFLGIVTNIGLVVVYNEPFRSFKDWKSQVIAYFALVILAMCGDVVLSALWPTVSSETNLASRRHTRQRQQALEYSKDKVRKESKLVGGMVSDGVAIVEAHGKLCYHQLPGF